MEGEGSTLASTAAGAVFLSYASQDAEAAQRICDALRAARIEVWFDKSELRGGDAWDRQIRKQIHDCALFVPIISQHTHERLEGYFRREWRLAIERAGDMAENKAFLVPVVIDGTTEQDPSIPEKFRELQWTRLPGGEAPPEFVARIKRLLSPERPTATRFPADAASGSPPIHLTRGRTPASRRPLPVAVLAVAALAYLFINKPWISKPAAPPTPRDAASSPVLPTAFNPPPHSIAVLPFVNMSGDKEQEYFSDGLSEELLNDLARIGELQVAARTSAFSFKGKDTDIGTIARKLNVGTVLEGSVRRSGHKVRITAQLDNAVTGFHIWSQTFDRDLGDVLQLQTELATEVAGALKVRLLGDATARIESGGTRNPAALDAYLRAMNAYAHAATQTDLQVATAAYSEAIRLDPKYALAFAGRSLSNQSWWVAGQARREAFDEAQADARQAIALAPELGDGHLALAEVFEQSLDFALAATEYERALTLAPGNARVLRNYATFMVSMGRTDAGIAAARRAAVLDPLNTASRNALGAVLFLARRYDEALAPLQEAITLDPAHPFAYAWRGFAYRRLGDFQSALASCEAKPSFPVSQMCLVVAYEKLGRHADAQAMLAKMQAENGDAQAYLYAAVYADLGNVNKALEWLETAYRLRDSNLEYMKTSPNFDALRSEPRFQAIERELKFPN